MASQYDSYWARILPQLTAAIGQAATEGGSVSISISDVQDYGQRQSWDGSVMVMNGSIVGRGRGAHMRALGEALRPVSRQWPTCVVQCRMTRNAALTMTIEQADARTSVSGEKLSRPTAPPSGPMAGKASLAVWSLPGDDTETLRRQFRPDPVRYLMIGESAPAGGTFFYRANSALFRHTRDTFAAVYGSDVGDGSAFLRWWQDHGWYLEDLCPTPVNRLSPAERRQRHRTAEGYLIHRLAAGARPSLVVYTPLAIGPSVGRVMTALGWTDIIPHGLKFPGRWWSQDFQAGLAQILKTR